MKCAGTVGVLLLIVPLSPLMGQVRAYLKMDIDPGSRMVRQSDEVSIRRGFPTTEYFLAGLPSWNIERVVPSALEKRDAHPEYFHVRRDGVLLERFKDQEVFSNDIGTIVAHTRYQYQSEYGPGFGAPSLTIDVRADTSTVLRERPTIIGDLPGSATPLRMITVIRLSAVEGINFAAVGTYSAQGELVGVAKDRLKHGEHPFPTTMIPPTMTMEEADENSIRLFGFPLRFSISEFRSAPTPLYERYDGPSPLTVICFHYAQSRWLEQYVFHDSLRSPVNYERRILEYRSTPQDETLRYLDEALPWKPWGEKPVTIRKR